VSSSASPPRAVDAVQRFVAAHPALIAVALFALASAARLALVLTSRFNGDEVDFWGAGRDIASGIAFPLLGPPITGGGAQHPGPLLYWVIAIPMLLTHAPEAANAFVALLGGLTVVLYWQSLRSYFGEMGALLAAVMMACSPWSTMYADRVWNPNVVGIFVAIAFWASCRLRRSPSLLVVVVLFMSMAAMPQLHMSSPIVWAALVPIWLPSVRKWRWYWPLLAVAGALLLYVPMLISELRNHWENVRTFLQETSSNTSSDFVRTPLWAFRLLTLDVTYHQMHGYWGPHTEGEMLSFIFHGNADFQWNVARWFVLFLSVALALFALVSGAIHAWNKEGRREAHPFFWAAVVGLLANTALLGVAHKEIFGHYVQALLPFYFVAFAELGRWAATDARLSLLVSGAAALVCVGGVDAATWVSGTMDARSGLRTVRRVIAAVEEDDPKAMQAGIYFDFRTNPRAYDAISLMNPAHPVRFGYGSKYQLLLNRSPAPAGGKLLLQTGPVTLYRMR